MNELYGIDDRAIDVAFGGQVKDSADLVITQSLLDEGRIVDRSFYEVESRVLIRSSEVSAISGIGEGIKDHNAVDIGPLEELPHKSGPNEASPSGEQN